MNDICKKCSNLPCKNKPERRIRNLPFCEEDKNHYEKDEREVEVE